MIIKKLAGLCKASKTLLLFDTPGGEQWAGDGSAFYELSGIPAMGPNGLCAVMDITPEKAADMRIERAEWPLVYCLDGVAEETPLDYNPEAYIVYDGWKLMPCTDGSRLAFIQTKYLSPLADAETITLALRQTKGGEPYIVAKAGLFVVGVIMPTTIGREKLIWMGEIYGLACEEERERATDEQ